MKTELIGASQNIQRIKTLVIQISESIGIHALAKNLSPSACTRNLTNPASRSLKLTARLYRTPYPKWGLFITKATISLIIMSVLIMLLYGCTNGSGGGGGSSNSDVNVTLENSAPVADAGPDQTAQSNDIVQLDGGGSTDGDGDSLIYFWSFITMPAGSGALLSDPTAVNPSFVVDIPGTYVAQLIVNDGTVDSAPDTVTINWENSAPVADAGPDQTSMVDTEVTFDGSDSYDIDDGIKAYNWDFGDQTSGSGITTTHAYSTAGTYTVTLTVTDNSDETSTDTAQVTVTEQSTLVMHVESIEMDLNTELHGKNEFTNALAIVTIFDGESPVDGATVYGSWSGATSDSVNGVTDTSGKVTLESNWVKNPSSGTTFIFKVDNVVKPSWTYVPSSNKETTDSVSTP